MSRFYENRRYSVFERLLGAVIWWFSGVVDRWIYLIGIIFSGSLLLVLFSLPQGHRAAFLSIVSLACGLGLAILLRAKWL